MTDLSQHTALVTGANRGLGRAMASELLGRGATVYAGARDPGRVDLPGVRPVRLDITDPSSVREAVEATGDVSILVNNAGSATGSNLVDGDLDKIRLEMDTHYFGTLSVVRAFAPQLMARPGSAVLNVLSVLSWYSSSGSGAYCAAKAAEWSMTNSLRLQLAQHGVSVTGLHVGPMDTDMMQAHDGPKTAPEVVARKAVDALVTGQHEVLADEVSRQVRAQLSGPLVDVYPGLASGG